LLLFASSTLSLQDDGSLKGGNEEVLPDLVELTLPQCGQRMLAAPRLYTSMVKQPPQTSSDMSGPAGIMHRWLVGWLLGYSA